ncbi:hypothetical protein DICVIV_04454 [Dictyocaulus viviparus]|uniref:Uncharacterized protein n=1 Tax=Dictyocaulus viviparus TaxID=29172 RepID=A0A0D8XZY1_DICVI|nr:hypothetical protein DICVIV_04454 [Dictyocaulus viviparus]
MSARHSRRLRSCPSSMKITSPSYSVSSPQRSVPVSARYHTELCWSPTSDPLLLNTPLSFRISEPFMLSKLAAQCDSPPPEIVSEFEPTPMVAQSILEDDFSSDFNFSYPQCCPPAFVHEPAVPRLLLDDSPPLKSRVSARFHTTLFPIAENRPSYVLSHREHSKPIMQRKKKERIAKMNDPLHDVDWLNVSPRVMQLVKDDLPKLFEHVRAATSDSASVVLVSPRSPTGLTCMENWDSYIKMLEEYNKPYER